jgi:Tfp pilus assembly protein PilF
MYEDAIKCLYASNNREDAEKLANEVITKHPEPGIYCLLGELKNNKDLFFKALEITNNKYPRAYRCLGRYYYSIEKNIEKAKEYYEKAMSINPSFPSIWFTLGMIYLGEKNFNKSLVAFSKILANDDSNGDVWGNMGVCFIHLNKFKEAEKCLEEGYFKSKNNWRMLDNLVYVSIENKNLSKILFAINEYYSIGHEDKIKNSYFLFATKLYMENFKKYSEHDREYLKNKIFDLFERYGDKDGLRPEIWDLYANFFMEIEMKYKIDKKEKIKCYKFLIELRIKEIRTITVKNINWDDKVKDVLSNIIVVIKKLVETIQNIYNENKDLEKESDYINDKIFYINGIEDKIKKSNEEKDSNNLQPNLV